MVSREGCSLLFGPLLALVLLICPAGSVTWPSTNHANSTQLCNTHKLTHTLLVLHPFNGWCSSHLQKYCPLKHDVSKDAILPHCPTSQMYKMVFKMAQQFKYSIRPAAVTHSLPVNKRIKQTRYFLSRTCWNAQAHTHINCATQKAFT